MDIDKFPAFFDLEFPRLVVHLKVHGFGMYAEDAAEDAMSEAYRKWDTIDTPPAWVRSVAVRFAQRAYDRDRLRGLSESAYLRKRPSLAALTPEAAHDLTEEERGVFEQLQAMPEMRRRVVALVFDGYSVREIAHELGIAESTVRSHIRHARDALGGSANGAGGAK